VLKGAEFDAVFKSMEEIAKKFNKKVKSQKTSVNANKREKIQYSHQCLVTSKNQH
jgi:hypothetical protein